MLRSCRLFLGAMTAAAIVVSYAPAAHASTTSSITGVVFQDTNRDGIYESGETPMSGINIYLMDSSGNFVANYQTDGSGTYTFTGLADGTYTVRLAPGSWYGIRQNWVPTTTGSLQPIRTVTLSGSAQVDFGWRQIVRSTNANAPISSYVGSNGLTVRSYDDVVDAQTIYKALMQGTMVGAEAAYVTIQFDLGSSAVTTASTTQTNGTYTAYSATSDIDYLTWLDSGDNTLFHEYGHAWSLYYAYMVQQDPSLTAYLKARGVYGDSRIGSSYAWDPREMIAEDYRQLFGTPNAAAGPQLNGDIPPAASVPGLANFLATTFRTPPSSGSTSTPPPAQLTVTGMSAALDSSGKSWTVSGTISTAATVTMTVLAGDGTTVKTLLSNVARNAGSVSAVWDGTDAKGRKVRRGTYTVKLQASASGQSAQGMTTVTE